MFDQVHCAPMEGVTRALFRREHHRRFGGCDRYFAPFLAPSADGVFSEKELREVRPQANGEAPTVPQLLAGRAEYFLWAARLLAGMGYRQVDFNLGCPSGTVVSKHKGSGLLADPGELDRLLDAIFSGLGGESLSISVKTRIGLEDSAHWPALVAVFNRYPICQLTIHPRLRRQFYKGRPDLEAFALGLEQSTVPVCYNGDIFTVEDAKRIKAQFPGVNRVMVGRGLVANPALARALGGGPPLTGGELSAFHDALLAGYCSSIQGEVNVLHKMKELWQYWACLYPGDKKAVKALRKTGTLADYRRAAAAILAREPREGGGFCPDLL